MHYNFNQLMESKIILLTCKNCQKIMDDQGNWHGRNDFRAAYQDVLFGYTRCHECALKHYAEFYKGVQQKATT